MARPDPHSYFDDTQPRTRHLELTLDVDFEERRLRGRATLVLDPPVPAVVDPDGPSPVLDLDTDGLTIEALQVDGALVGGILSDEDAVLGRRLRIDLPAGASRVTIDYQTATEAIGLQWLEPSQTAAGEHPFLFSQCQPIHARSVVPVQDSPAARVTFEAVLTVPAPLVAVMAAGPATEEPDSPEGTRTFRFKMPQAIPPYLIAFAVGDLEARDISERTRVWAEPSMVEAAAYEFAETEQMMATAEEMFGPYDWDRYDLLVLPPSFPYGGMENPRLTFLTPTVIAGDRSLVDVIAHELAHSWTGNLITNATFDHFWLNEGATTWAERRIVEALHGEESVALDWAIGEQGLQVAFDRFGLDSPLTRLRTDLEGGDPDDAYSIIPYEKGARFFALLERTAGRERFDAFIRRYIERYRFTSITTEEFVAFLDSELPGVAAEVGANAWLYAPGIPSNAPQFRSERLESLIARGAGFATGERPTAEEVAAWAPSELLVYLQHVPRPLPPEDCAWLDEHLSLMNRGNYELLVEWLTIAAASDYEPAFGRLADVLTEVGRMKYLRPLYLAMGGHPRTRALAREIFERASPGYHELSRRAAEDVMAGYPE
ncbi:MAG: M1 family metallopeptidase [Chloroflexi bacterium]|nr:M1 family metallopeptidase [Chloroflexota bacterium]MDA1148133.1 M1 family metallopeptidase [Chloroflexota bacterium]